MGASDISAVATMAYALVTGRPYADPMQVHPNAPVPWTVSETVASFLRQCWAARPMSRPTAVEALQFLVPSHPVEPAVVCLSPGLYESS